MKFLLTLLVLTFSLLILPRMASADLTPMPNIPLPTVVVATPNAPSLAAKSYMLMDYLSDHVIAEHDKDQRVEPASLTKMMTVYIADQALHSNKIALTDKVKVSENAWRTTGARMFLELNSEPTVDDLLKGIIIQSGNDASVALAEHIAGSETTFAELMNFYAKQLGMENTHFANATGMPDPNHYTTARDMAVLAKALIRDFPESYKRYSQKEFTYHNIKQSNRNRLLWLNDAVDGIKTGHTESAGFCLVASGQKEGMRLIAVIMGTANENLRSTETNKLLNYGFQFYETKKLYSGSTALKQVRVYMGRENEINLGLAQDLYVTISKGQFDRLKANITVEDNIKAPLKEGAVLGTLSVQLDDKKIIERPIVSLANVEESGFFGRMLDYIKITYHRLWNTVSS
jgi:D-alanyl-D-alanine carboxypeptidase (penicillin-binding protein 5/6)